MSLKLEVRVPSSSSDSTCRLLSSVRSPLVTAVATVSIPRTGLSHFPIRYQPAPDPAAKRMRATQRRLQEVLALLGGHHGTC